MKNTARRMTYRLIGYRGQDLVELGGVTAGREIDALLIAQGLARAVGVEVQIQHDRPSGRPGWMHVYTVDEHGTRERFGTSGIACDLLAAISLAFEAGAQDVWDDPQFCDARMLTKYAQASWDFEGWRPIMDSLRLHGSVILGGTVFA